MNWLIFGILVLGISVNCQTSLISIDTCPTLAAASGFKEKEIDDWFVYAVNKGSFLSGSKCAKVRIGITDKKTDGSIGAIGLNFQFLNSANAAQTRTLTETVDADGSTTSLIAGRYIAASLRTFNRGFSSKNLVVYANEDVQVRYSCYLQAHFWYSEPTHTILILTKTREINDLAKLKPALQLVNKSLIPKLNDLEFINNVGCTN